MRRLPAAALALALAAPARASNEDHGFGARSMGMADAMTAVPDDIAAMVMNPAALGQLRRAQVEAYAHRLFHAPAGPEDLQGAGIAVGVPLDNPPYGGALGFSWRQDDNRERTLDRSLAFTYATRSWREVGDGMKLDFGATLRQIRRSARNSDAVVGKPGLDLGTFLRVADDRSFGFSLLNINSPRTDVGGFADRAPLIVKLGWAQAVRRFRYTMDLSRRDGSARHDGNLSFAMGNEYEWSTANRGSLTARTGIHIGEVSRAWSLGFGWRVLGASFDYALRVPLSGGSRWSHGVALSYRFGTWNPETEYEKLLTSELQQRRDLSRSLSSSEKRQKELGAELDQIKKEAEALRRELERRADAEGKERLRRIEERRRRAESELGELDQDGRSLRGRDAAVSLREDWAGYQKLKDRGASDAVLIQRLRQILSEYKGTGVDLGEANRELQRLLGR